MKAPKNEYVIGSGRWALPYVPYTAVDAAIDTAPEDQWCPRCNECRTDFLIIDDYQVTCQSCGEVYDL